jgi:hypothetical protein
MLVFTAREGYSFFINSAVFLGNAKYNAMLIGLSTIRPRRSYGLSLSPDPQLMIGLCQPRAPRQARTPIPTAADAMPVESGAVLNSLSVPCP